MKTTLLNENPAILFIAPWYKYRPILIESLILQTEKGWKLYLIHDGPGQEDFYLPDDSRIEVEILPEKCNDQGNQWGHPVRAKAMYRVATEDWKSDWIVHTNADNYYVPGFIEIMLSQADGADLVYCDMIHSHKRWALIKSEMVFGGIDCGAVMVRADWAKQAGWPSRRFEADWDYFQSIYRQHPELKAVHVPYGLFIHN